MRKLVALVCVAFLAVACGGSEESSPDTDGSTSAATDDSSSPVTDESGLTALGPMDAAVGSVPRFEWSAVEAAAKYRLVVLGPNGPIWAWEGEATAVNLGGLTGDRPELMPGPVVEPGTSWSVAAFDPDDNLLAIVGPIEIAPADLSATQPESPEPTAEPTAGDLPDPCALVSQELIEEIFGEGSPEGESGSVTGPNNTSAGNSCAWSRGLPGLRAGIFISPSFLTPTEICDYCETIDGFGDEAWAGQSDRGSGGSIIAVVVGDLGVQVSADGLGLTVDDLKPIVEAILAGMP